MNAKLCKHPRRKARAATVGKSATQYVPIFGKGKHKGIKIAIGVASFCTRGVYRQLKRDERKAQA